MVQDRSSQPLADDAQPAGLLAAADLSELRQRRSAKWRMHAPDVLPSSIAEMDFGIAEPVAQALQAAIARNDLGYADGFDDLADAYAGFAASEWGWHPEPGRITAVTDVGVGVVELLRALDARRVVVNTPVYPPVQDWVSEVHAELVDVPLQHDGRIDVDRVSETLRPGDAYLVCNPQNPTGTVHTYAELGALVETASRAGATIVSDEIHAPLALAGATVTPILSVPGAADVAVALTSASKAWNLAGLKCALLLTGSAGMDDVVRRFPPDTRWRVGHLGVVASAAAFRDGGHWRQQLLATLDQRRHHFTRLVAEQLPELSYIPGQATYLAWLSCAGLTSGTDLAAATLDRGRVAVEAGEKFGSGGAAHVRLNLATSEELIARAVAGLRVGLDHVTRAR